VASGPIQQGPCPSLTTSSCIEFDSSSTGFQVSGVELTGILPGEAPTVRIPVVDAAGTSRGFREVQCAPAAVDGRSTCNAAVNEPGVFPQLGGLKEVLVNRVRPAPLPPPLLPPLLPLVPPLPPPLGPSAPALPPIERLHPAALPEVPVIPEAATLMLFGIGIAALGVGIGLRKLLSLAPLVLVVAPVLGDRRLGWGRALARTGAGAYAAPLPEPGVPVGAGRPAGRPLAPSPVGTRIGETGRHVGDALAAWWATAHARLRALARVEGIEPVRLVLFAGSLVVYAVTRLVALDLFPIYFFADEAIEALLASDLLRRGLRDERGNLFPMFFDAYGYSNPLVSVYAHAVTVLLFGKSVIGTRATAALITLLGAVAVALILKLVFRIRYWWAGVLLLGISPAWFLHSRTAFETSFMVSMYACFLLCYLLYRYRSPRFLYAALGFAAATYYSYGNGQILIGVSGLLLALSDLPYHLRKWRSLLVGLGLVLVLAFPVYQWRTQRPEAVESQLARVNSYLVHPLPLQDKMREFTTRYTHGLSPQYWFLPDSRELVRHRVGDLGHILPLTLPFFLLGVARALRHLGSSAYRTVLIAALAAPVSGALTDVGITRVLAFVVPATLFTALGLDLLLGRLRGAVAQLTAAIGTGVVLALTAVWMLHFALTTSATWTRDFGLHGTQWGAKQLFEILAEDLKREPDSRFYLTSTWANGTEVLLSFFVTNEPRVSMRSVDGFLMHQQPLDGREVFIMTPAEYRAAQASGKFHPIVIERTLHYPDGSDGFYWARLAYVPGVETLYAADQEARRQLVADQVEVGGEVITVRHSTFDGGRAMHLFDRNRATLARGMEANPLILELEFPTPRPLAGLTADFGAMDLELNVVLTGLADGTVPYQLTVGNVVVDPQVDLTFDRGPALVTKARLEVGDLRAGERANVHVREIALR
jgi:hypothetical protein